MQPGSKGCDNTIQMRVRSMEELTNVLVDAFFLRLVCLRRPVSSRKTVSVGVSVVQRKTNQKEEEPAPENQEAEKGWLTNISVCTN